MNHCLCSEEGSITTETINGHKFESKSTSTSTGNNTTKSASKTKTKTKTSKHPLEESPLAFSSDPSLIPATSRLGVPTRLKDKTIWINVEIFEHGTGPDNDNDANTNTNDNDGNNGTGAGNSNSNSNSNSTAPLVIYIPGICESAETKTVQEMAQWAKTIGVRLAVIELPGHGLSTGDDVSDMSTNLDILIKQVLATIQRILALMFFHQNSSIECDHENDHHPKTTKNETPYVLSGSSFGGTLALYAAEYISRRQDYVAAMTDTSQQGFIDTSKQDTTNSLLFANKREESIVKDEDLWIDFFLQGRLASVVAVTPAVGVDPKALPPTWMIQTLSLASWIAPTDQLPFTPLEDSAQYDCPKTTTRNFKGRWPLVTSKFLLDVTVNIVPEDVAKGRLSLKNIPRVVLLAGAKDPMIPMESIQAVETSIQAPRKDLLVLPKAGHDVLTNPKSSAKALETLFGALL